MFEQAPRTSSKLLRGLDEVRTALMTISDLKKFAFVANWSIPAYELK